METFQPPAGSDLQREIDKVAAVIATARNRVAEGRLVELSSLEGKVASLCAAIKTTPPADREAVTATLERLVGHLDGLAKDVRNQHAELRAREDDANRRAAIDAYGRGPRTD